MGCDYCDYDRLTEDVILVKKRKVGSWSRVNRSNESQLSCSSQVFRFSTNLNKIRIQPLQKDVRCFDSTVSTASCPEIIFKASNTKSVGY